MLEFFLNCFFRSFVKVALPTMSEDHSSKKRQLPSPTSEPSEPPLKKKKRNPMEFIKDLMHKNADLHRKLKRSQSKVAGLEAEVKHYKHGVEIYRKDRVKLVARTDVFTTKKKEFMDVIDKILSLSPSKTVCDNIYIVFIKN